MADETQDAQDETTSQDAEHLKQIRAARATEGAASLEVDRISGQLKDAKKTLDAAHSALLRIIDKPADPMLPFDESDEDEAWRDESIAVLGLSDTLDRALAEAGIKTLGTLADYSNDGEPLTGIAGIGEAGATKIEESVTAYWADRKAQSEPEPKAEDVT